MRIVSAPRDTRDAWNHNTHFHAALLRRLPRRVERALDIGCGDGRFAATLSQRAVQVVALDPDESQVAITRERCAALTNVTVRHTSLLSGGLASGGFDAIAALASLHHMPMDRAIAECRDLLSPGGHLVILGVWTDATSRTDLVLNTASSVFNKVLQRRRGPDVMGSPAVLPTTTYRETSQQIRAALPGATIRRRLLWRYIVVWRKP